MSKFTPGPWRVERIKNDIEISAETDHGSLSVAWVHMGDERDDTQDKACFNDAHLIAAAPEMLHALKRVWDIMPDDMSEYDLGLVGEAIAKAEATQ